MQVQKCFLLLHSCKWGVESSEPYIFLPSLQAKQKNWLMCPEDLKVIALFLHFCILQQSILYVKEELECFFVVIYRS